MSWTKKGFGHYFDKYGFQVLVPTCILVLLGFIFLPSIVSCQSTAEREKAWRKNMVNSISYMYDERTEQCFAKHGHGLTWVPCTKKVMKLIK